ncbi:MAG: heme-binding protein [Deltaproteobacteria bacterium]
MSATFQTQSLTAEAAHVAVDAAIAKARKLGCRINCAIVDPGGNLLAFLRDPGAPLHSIDIAIDKAYTAVSFRCPTAKLYEVIDGAPSVRDGIIARPRLTAFGGGVPVTLDGHLVGGVGVSGAAEHEDQACAEAAQAAIEELKTNA